MKIADEGYVESQKELFDEIHSYVRQHFTLLINWFTFFCTSNYVALGWFISLASEGKLKNSDYVPLVAIFFVVQNFLGFVACSVVSGHFKKSFEKEREILREISDGNKGRSALRVMPFDFYKKIIRILMVTLLTFILFWISVSLMSGGNFYGIAVSSKNLVSVPAKKFPPT